MITYRHWIHSLRDDAFVSISRDFRALHAHTIKFLRRHFPHDERLTRIFICVLLFLILALYLPFLHRAESAANTAAFLGPTYGALVGFSVLVIGVLLNRLERRTRTRHELRRRQVRVAHAIRIELIDILATRRSFLDVMESLEPEARITRKMLYNPDNFQEQRELPHRSQFMDQIEGFPLELASTIHAAYAEIRNANNFERFMSSYHKSNSAVTDEEQAEQIKSVQRTLQRCSRAVNDLDKWILSNHVE